MVIIIQFIQTDFFTYPFTESIQGIITDVPYKGCLTNKLEEQDFDVAWFLQKCDELTPKDSFLITFSNMAMILDMRSFAKDTNWIFQTYQIWNKEPLRTWIAWSKPLRTCEFILYFTKGNYKLNFKDGTIKEKVNRKSFGGSLKQTSPNTNKKSFGMYSEILTYKTPKTKIHPTQKPTEFSSMFKQVLGQPDGIILDPFCGSGSLLKAFNNSIGIDVKNWINPKNKSLSSFVNEVKSK